MSTIRPHIEKKDLKDTTIRPDMMDNGNLINSTIRPDAESTVRPSVLGDKSVSPTICPNSSGTINPHIARDVTTCFDDKIDTQMYQARDSYLINGTKYRVNQPLSLTSGEAQVFLVENSQGEKLVLKLYYKGTTPNIGILNKLLSVGNANILIEEISHGEFEDRYFELMKYYEGDNLESIDVSYNEVSIFSLIKDMAIAIDFCHHLGFIHRDVKPSNFIFDTKQRTHLLLGDFGIAVECDKNGQCVADMARTKTFAAPEVYLNTGDGKAKFSSKSDFYSLGIVILYLWMGKEKFTRFEKENELQLATMKTYGSLPIPDNMPSRLYALVKALIEPNPTHRAGYQEVEEWLKGNNPFGQSDLQSESTSSKQPFRIVYNGEKNLVASSPKELARIMFSNQQLSTSYLYKGKISQWLEDNGRPELAVEMERIKEDLYPKNPVAGLEAACYILNPAMPFVDICGNNCTTSSEISQSILKNFDKYLSQLSMSIDTRLIVYLQTHGHESTVIKFRQEYSNNNRLGLLYLAYSLDPNQPWYMNDADGQEISLNSGDEILNWVSENAASDQSLMDIVSNAFYIWIKNRNSRAAAAIKPLMCYQGNLDYSEGVLYRLNLKVGLYYILDETSPRYTLTVQQIGELINKCTMAVVNKTDTTGTAGSILSDLFGIRDGKKTSIYHYLKSKGAAYEKWIDWIKDCLDVNSKDNTHKAGPNNEMIGLFKLIKGMSGKAYYTFKSGETTIYNPTEISKVSVADLQEARNNQSRAFEAWISVFYQEDPLLDKSIKYTYEKRTEDYLKFLSSIGFESPEIQRYKYSKKIVESRAKKLRNSLSFVKKSRLVVSFLVLLPLGIAALLLTFLWRPDFGSLEFWTVFKPIAVILTICLCFMDGFVGKIIGEAIWGCIIGAIVSLVVVWASGSFSTLTPYIAAIMIAILGCYVYKKCLVYDLKEKANSFLLTPEFEHTGLEPLYEAYHPNTNGFDSSIGDKTEAYQKELDRIKKIILFRAIPVGIITILGLLYLFFYTPSAKLSNYENPNPEHTELQVRDFSNGLSGTWVGKMKSDNIKIVFEKTDSPDRFTMIMSDLKSKDSQLIFKGKFDITVNQLTIQNCEIVNDSGISLKTKAFGTLELTEDKIVGKIDVNIEKSGINSMSLPIDIQYVSE